MFFKVPKERHIVRQGFNPVENRSPKALESCKDGIILCRPYRTQAQLPYPIGAVSKGLFRFFIASDSEAIF